MIDYNTILSTTEDKMTLLQWLKKVEAALKDASATTFKVNKKGNATLTFSIEFADGSELESGEIILQQGESVESASIVNGHLILTLTNGDELDAGDLGGITSFSIDASQHLIVHYQNGTTQDLGAIFTGNVTITGDLVVTGKINNVPNPSVKPIYFHPIWVRDNVNNMSQFTMIILDNDPTPYTWARILAFLDVLPVGSRLNCSGSITYTGTACDIVCLEKRGSNVFMFRVTRLSDNVQLSIVLNDISYTPTNVEDGVNKIN